MVGVGECCGGTGGLEHVENGGMLRTAVQLVHDEAPVPLYVPCANK